MSRFSLFFTDNSSIFEVDFAIARLVEKREEIEDLLIRGQDYRPGMEQASSRLFNHFLSQLAARIMDFSNIRIKNLKVIGNLKIDLAEAKLLLTIQKQLMASTEFSCVKLTKEAFEWLCPKWRNECSLSQTFEHCRLSIQRPEMLSMTTTSLSRNCRLEVNVDPMLRFVSRDAPLRSRDTAKSFIDSCLDISNKTGQKLAQLTFSVMAVSVDAFGYALKRFQLCDNWQQVKLSFCTLASENRAIEDSQLGFISYYKGNLSISGCRIGFVESATIALLLQSTTVVNCTHNLVFENSYFDSDATQYMLAMAQQLKREDSELSHFESVEFKGCRFSSQTAFHTDISFIAQNARGDNVIRIMKTSSINGEDGVVDDHDDNIIMDRLSLTERIVASLEFIRDTSFPNITGLAVMHDDLGDGGIGLISQHLNDLALKDLVLDVSNSATSEGMEAFALSLKNNKHLAMIQVASFDVLLTAFAKKLLTILKKCKNMTLKSVCLLDAVTGEFHSPYNDEIQYYLSLNRLGRKHLLKSHNDLPAQLLPLVLAKARHEPFVLFWVLQTCPHVVALSSGSLLVGQKRKRIHSQK